MNSRIALSSVQDKLTWLKFDVKVMGNWYTIRKIKICLPSEKGSTLKGQYVLNGKSLSLRSVHVFRRALMCKKASGKSQ